MVRREHGEEGANLLSTGWSTTKQTNKQTHKPTHTSSNNHRITSAAQFFVCLFFSFFIFLFVCFSFL